MDLELTDKVVAITGGSDGLGFGLAERLLAEGAAVAICSRRDDAVAMAVEQLQAKAAAGRLHEEGRARAALLLPAQQGPER